jgi:hypothetical protein
VSATEFLSLEKVSFRQKESEKFKDAKKGFQPVNLGLDRTGVKAGQDDRWTRLHEASFLAGADCTAASCG